MSRPFEPIALGGIQFKNRVVRSATHEGLADEKGFPTAALKQRYVQLAKGGIGGIITGYAAVQPDGKSPLYRMLMIDDDAAIPAYRELTEAVHAEGVPILLQIAHCGRQTRSAAIGYRPVAPSAIRDKYFVEDVPRALTDAEIETIIGNFVEAAARAQKAGFDGVQLHAAHGYLLSEFLSPYMNKRTDKWGGAVENRCRILVEILKRTKEQLGEYPVWVKLNAFDGRKGGMTVAEATVIAKLLEAGGCRGIEVSCGVNEDKFLSSRFSAHPAEALLFFDFRFEKVPAAVKPWLVSLLKKGIKQEKPLRLFNLPAARVLKQAVSIPIMVVGGVRTLGDIHEVIDDSGMDLVSLCKPLLLEPNLIGKFQTGQADRARCIDCCYCMLGAEKEPTRCYFGKLPKPLGR